MDKYQKRLDAEADFQNSRSSGELELHNRRRSKFYYLIDNARSYYDQILYELIIDKRVIVAGCAEGSVTPLTRSGAKKVTGVDIASEPINKLNQSIDREGLSGKAEAIVGNAEDLPLPNDSFDVICCSGVLHHLDIRLAMNSWSRVLNKDGAVIMMEPMALNPIIFLYRLLTPKMRTKDEHPLLPRDIRILNDYFSDVKVEGFVLTSLFSLLFTYMPNNYLRNKSYVLLENVDRKILKWFPKLSYICWTSVIILKSPRNRIL